MMRPLSQREMILHDLKISESLLFKNLNEINHNKHLSHQAFEKQKAIEHAEIKANIMRLEAIYESGITLEKYTSLTQGECYATREELQQNKTTQLPKTELSLFAIKQKKQSNNSNNSHIKLINDNAEKITSFFMEHKKSSIIKKNPYPSGSCAKKVKQGSFSEDNGEPKYAVKIYRKEIFNYNETHILRLAMRAACCYKKLGREAYVFRQNHKQYLVTDWIKGKTLDQANKKDIQSMPISRRMIMLISLLREINVLHKQGIIHNDIKPSNIMINDGVLCLIDLDSVSLKHEKPFLTNSPLHTPSYLVNSQMALEATYSKDAYLHFNENTDLYALGITLASLFPEIYEAKRKENKIKIENFSKDSFKHTFYNLKQGKEFSHHPDLQKLINNMRTNTNEKLTTCEDYIQELQNILPKYKDYKNYLQDEKNIALDEYIKSDDGEKAFKEIEVELVCYNQRVENLNNKFKI